jgi:hypothetical protein
MTWTKNHIGRLLGGNTQGVDGSLPPSLGRTRKALSWKSDSIRSGAMPLAPPCTNAGYPVTVESSQAAVDPSSPVRRSQSPARVACPRRSPTRSRRTRDSPAVSPRSRPGRYPRSPDTVVVRTDLETLSSTSFSLHLQIAMRHAPRLGGTVRASPSLRVEVWDRQEIGRGGEVENTNALHGTMPRRGRSAAFTRLLG